MKALKSNLSKQLIIAGADIRHWRTGSIAVNGVEYIAVRVPKAKK